MLQVIEEEKPDVVFTHWPIELHRDHRNCSALVLDAWKHSGRNCDLYYYEAELGQQTRNFTPNSYVNIESVVEQKHKALLCHESQKPQEILDRWHNDMEKFRGMESECSVAEAFVLLQKTRN